MAFKIRIEPEAHEDIQDGILWYNEQKPGLGKNFHAQVKIYFNKLKINPFFQVRYNDVHCLPIKKFPYMIHFTIDEANKTIIVHAVLNTHRDPEIGKKRS